MAVAPPHPFLVGRGLRELNPASAEERALAAALTPRLLLVNVSRPRGLVASAMELLPLIRPRLSAGLKPELARLASQYDRAVFVMEEPADPASPSTVIIAVVVLILEVLAMLHYLLHVPRGGWTPHRVGYLAVLEGLLGLGLLGIGSVAWAEVAGAAWRATTQRTATAVAMSPVADGLEGWEAGAVGSVVVHEEAVLLVVRNGYHPRLVVGVACASAAAAAAVAVPLLVAAAVLTHRERRRRWRGALLAGGVVAVGSTGAGGKGAPLPVAGGAGAGGGAQPVAGEGGAGNGAPPGRKKGGDPKANV